MMNELCKCKLIGDGKAKPFWAMSDDANDAYRLCREFMRDMIYEAREDWYMYSYLDDNLFNLIKYAHGARAYQSEHNFDGRVCKRICKNKRRSRWQRSGHLRIYDAKLDQKIKAGYLPTPHLKVVPVKLKDPSGVHCKTVTEIATIMMEKIVSNYFHNTLLFASLNNDFHITLCVKSGDFAISEPKECIMALFLAYLKYNEFVKDDYQKARDTQLGTYEFSAISKDGTSFGSDIVDGIPFSHYEQFHYFDKIHFCVKQMQQGESKPHSCHHSIMIDSRFFPTEYYQDLERRDAV